MIVVPEWTQRTKAVILSAVTHCILFLVVGYFMLQEESMPKEDLIELAMVSDTEFIHESAQSGGMAKQDFDAPEIQVPKIQSDEEQMKEEEVRPSHVSVENPGRPEAPSQAVSIDESGISETVGQGINETGNGAGHSISEGQGPGRVSSSGPIAGKEPVQKEQDSGVVSPPSILARVKPDYPAAVQRKKIEGTVYLRVQVMENGSAAGISVVSSSGHAALDEAAVQAVSKWRFIPAKNGAGTAISCYMRIPVVFKLTNRRCED